MARKRKNTAKSDKSLKKRNRKDMEVCMFGASGSGSMLQNPAETKNYKVNSSLSKKNRGKQNPQKESFHKSKHHSVSDCSPGYAPLKLKITIKEDSQFEVHVINHITSKRLSSIKSSVSPKLVKPKKTKKEYLNVHISQDVALANEPVHRGIADSVKTKKRRCKDKGSNICTPECSFNAAPPMLMLSPKKRKARKNVKTDVPPKKCKSETSLNKRSNKLDKRKTLGNSRELYKRIETEPPNVPTSTFIPKRDILDLANVLIPTLTPKRDILDLTPPFDVIFDMERRLLQNQKCNPKKCDLDEVESTVMDPIFKNIAEKFQESAETVVSEYLAGGCPNVEEIEKVSFEPVLAEKIQLFQSFDQGANPGNVFLSCTSSQELVIASFEDAVEVKVEIKAENNSNSLESPPYGSQDSGYTSMTSPFSDDPECLNATSSKSGNQVGRPLRLTDVQFLKLCHSYSKCGNSKKWSAKKLVNSQNSKTSLQHFMNNPTTNPKNSQLPKVKIISNKCNPREETRKEFSPRGNEHAKALHDRRVVYLGNIPKTYTTQYLREKFKRFGEIENIQIKSKESEEFDTVDHRFLASQPLRGNSSNSGKGKAQKGKIMKHFGFVTFKKISVAREVFDKRRELCTWAGGSINYGGRREFVREDYADFDAEANNLNPGCSFKHNQENEVDYTQLLKKEQEKRGLIVSPNSKRPQHSQHV